MYGDNFITSAKKAYFLLKRNNNKKVREAMSAGDYAIWALQLCLIFPAPFFGAWWIHYEEYTFAG
jgi:hypothetical protein